MTAFVLPTTPGARAFQGVLLAALTALLVAGLHTMVRAASVDLGPAAIVFWRTLVSVVVLLPFLLWTPAARGMPGRPWLHLARGLVQTAAMVLGFWSLALLPLATATVIGFTAVIFTAIGGALIFHEPLTTMRVAAVPLGFAGVGLAVGTEAFDPASVQALGLLTGLAGAVCFAGGQLLVRALARKENGLSVLLWMNVIILPSSLVPALASWSWPGPADWPLLGALGVVGVIAHALQVAAVRMTDAIALGPIDYPRLVWATALGAVFLGEAPEPRVLAGGAVVVATAVALGISERRRTNEARRRAA